jgi:predicted ATPase
MPKNKIIITGGPGSGKTSLIYQLKQLGHFVVEEKARLLIKDQMALQSNKLPWQDVLGFSMLLVEKILEDRQIAPFYFMDRGIPDIEGYLNHAKLTYDNAIFDQAIEAMSYNSLVFFAPFWSEIYIQDQERKESPEEAEKIANSIKEVYQNRGFELVILPYLSVNQRVKFVLEQLKLK